MDVDIVGHRSILPFAIGEAAGTLFQGPGRTGPVKHRLSIGMTFHAAALV
jgi:hypothetical protein